MFLDDPRRPIGPPSRTERRPMKNEPSPRGHLPTDPPSTVIHHPEEDETLLAQWLRHVLAKGPSFWVLVGGAVVIAAGVAYLVGGITSGETETSRAWGQVMLASTPEEFQAIAETSEETRAGEWAGLLAASERYREGISRLPTDRDVAAPLLSQALEGFRTLADDPKGDAMLRRLAMVGVARTLETRDELPDAISTYSKIAEMWPDTGDGKASAARAKLLAEPVATTFYKQFSEFKARSSSTTIGPRGTNRIDLPPGHPGLDGGAMPAPPLIGGGPADTVPSPEGELPRDVFQKAEPPRADVPADVFQKTETPGTNAPASDIPILPEGTPYRGEPKPKDDEPKSR